MYSIDHDHPPSPSLPPPPPSPLPCCRPTEFLPVEYSGVRGIEQRMYKEQENLKLHSHKEIQQAYINHCAKICSPDSVFFPARVGTK